MDIGVNVPGKKLGKLAPKFLRGLPAFDRIVAHLPTPPPSAKYSVALREIGLMANDRIGDCTCAAIGHAIQLWTASASSEITLSDDIIIDLYSKVSGYVRGDANTDGGAVVSEVLLHWYKNPVADHVLSGFASIRPGNRTSIRSAIYINGICYLGVELPLTAQSGDWILPANQPMTGNWERGSWGGHAIVACDYNEDGVTVISWGKLIKVGWNWLDAYMDEAYALLSRDWLNAAGTSLPGFDWKGLQDAMNELKSSP